MAVLGGARTEAAEEVYKSYREQWLICYLFEVEEVLHVLRT